MLLAVATMVPLPAWPVTFSAKPVATALDFPAAFTIAPDGRIFYGERFTGEIRIFDAAMSQDTLFFTVPDVPPPTATTSGYQIFHTVGGEQGLLGLALHPDYPSSPFVYAFATQEVGGVHENHVLRIRNAGGTGTDMTVLVTEPAEKNHNGGPIRFGPDRKLYAMIGDREDAACAAPHEQCRKGAAHGTGRDRARRQPVPVELHLCLRDPKLLRVHLRSPDREAVGDGQRAGVQRRAQPREARAQSRRGAVGNPYHPSRSACEYQPGRPEPAPAETLDATPLAVTGAAFCMSCRLGSASERALFVGTWVTHEVRLARLPSDPLPAERLFVGTCVTHEVRRALLTRRRNSIASQSVVHRHGSGVLAFARGPDGRLYFSDSAAIYRLTLSGKTRHQSEQCDARHRSGRVGNGSLDDLARGCRKRFASPNSEIGAKNLCRPA